MKEWIVLLGGIWSILAGAAFVTDFLILLFTHGKHGVRLFVREKRTGP